jgi:signal transduction histidine kinase
LPTSEGAVTFPNLPSLQSAIEFPVMSVSIRTLCAGCLAGVLIVGAAKPEPPPKDARLESIREDVMTSAPSADQLVKIPAVLALADSFLQDSDPAKAGAAINYAVIYALLANDLDRAIALANIAARLCAEVVDRRCFGNAMNQSAVALWRKNDPYAAIQRLDRAARAFRAAGDTERAALASVNSANIRYGIGDLQGALADYQAVDTRYDKDPNWDPVVMLNSKTEVLLKLGRIEEARQTSRRALAALARRPRSKGTRWEGDVANNTRQNLALVEASLGNAGAALPLFRETVASADLSGSPRERFIANIAFAEGLMKLGRPRAAYAAVETALPLIGEADPASRRDAYALASRISADVGRTSEALAHLRAAEQVRNEVAAATLRSAINDANAQMAVAEREAQMARRDAAWAEQRSQLFGWIAFAIICLIGLAVSVLLRLRAQAIEQRFAAVLNERTRMARELHDTLLQGFTGITLQLRAASRNDPARINSVLDGMADEASRWLSETRHAVWDMRAATAGEDLETGLDQAVATARLPGGPEIELDCRIETRPSAAVTGAMLRVAQEALSNAARHAGASRIDVSVHTTAARARLAVRDNGMGFQASPELSALGGHWGLLGMRERVEALGGSFTVDSAPGRGTEIVAELPR